MKGKTILGLFAGLLAVGLCLAADGAWLQHVPDAERAKVNPYAGNTDGIAAGHKVYLDHCAKCHGDDGLGRRKKPGIRSGRVQNAKDGELFWLLKNGNLAHGMPSWSSLPEPTRWQVVAFVKSMGTSMFSGKLSRAPLENGR